MSLAWGLPQTEIEQSVAARDVEEMAQFYGEEPWGSYRDNIHAAIVASTIRNTFRKKGSRAVDWQTFMLVDKTEHKRGNLSKFVSWMRAMAKPKDDKRGAPSQT